MHDRAIGERPAAEDGSEQRPVRRAVRATLRAELGRAPPRVAAAARRARAARRPPRDDHAVAGRHRRHLGADLLDDAGALVTEEDREGHPPAVRLDDVNVRVAETARLDAHLHLARPGSVEDDLLDGRRSARLGVDDAARHDTARRSCSSSGTSGSWNTSTAARIGDDVVAELEHRQLVARHRRAGQPVGERRLRAHEPDRHVDRRAPRAEHALQALPEAVPRRRLRTAELERAPEHIRVLDRLREVLRDVLDPDRLEPPRPVADDRRHGRVAREPHERRQDAAVVAEHEARPEDDVLEARRADGALHLPFRGEVRHRVLRALVEAERAHEDEPPDARHLGRSDEVPGSVLHHALEVAARALDDRHEMDDRVGADAGGAQHGRVAHVPDDELDAPGGEPRGAPAVADDRAHVNVARTERVHDVVADEAGPAGDEDDHSKFLK